MLARLPTNPGFSTCQMTRKTQQNQWLARGERLGSFVFKRVHAGIERFTIHGARFTSRTMPPSLPAAFLPPASMASAPHCLPPAMCSTCQTCQACHVLDLVLWSRLPPSLSPSCQCLPPCWPMPPCGHMATPAATMRRDLLDLPPMPAAHNRQA